MREPERSIVVYVTADSTRWLLIDVPSGLITPPVLALHKPFEGPADFFYASSYRLPVPAEAEAAVARLNTA